MMRLLSMAAFLWLAACGAQLHAQRGTITIPTGAEVTVPAGAQICADTIVVHGTLTCASADGVCPGTIVVCIGTVTPSSLCAGGPAITAQQTLDFGNVLVGGSDTLLLEVRNSGNLALVISGTTVSPGGGSFAIVSGGGAQSVPAGGSIQIAVRFQPGTAGPAAATLRIQNNSPVPDFDVDLRGAGVTAGPIIEVSAMSLAFGRVPLGQQSSTTLIVRNTGTAPLQLAGQRTTGPDSAQFTIVEPCSATIGVGQRDTMTLRFSPAVRGAKSATLALASNAGGAAVTLAGTGTGPAIAASPSSVDFAAVTVGASFTRSLTVSNAGEGTLAVTAQTITGTDAADFVLQRQAAAAIDSGRSETVEIRFSPSSTGAKTAVLTIASSDPERPSLTIALSGSGSTSTQPRIAVAASVEFGNVAPGASAMRDVMIRNSGTAVLALSSQTASGAGFSIQQNAASSIAAGDSSTVRLRFEPSAAGDYAGTLTIASNDPSTPSAVVALHGSSGSTPARIAVNRTIVDFGRIQVLAAKDEAVLVTNIGGSPLEITRQTIAGRDSLEFSVQAPVASPLAPNASGTITVRLRPASVGAKTARLTIASNDPGAPSFEVGLIADVVLAVERTAQTPAGIRLRPCYPNPFNPTTTLEYEVDRPGEVRLTVYNAYGAEVITLDAGRREAGVYRVTWNAGRHPSGVYVAELRAEGPGGELVDRIPMVLAK